MAERCLSMLLRVSWEGAVLIALILMIQWALGRRLDPRWRSALWLMVLVRLALPWTVPSRASVFNVVGFPGRPAGWSFAGAKSDVLAGQNPDRSDTGIGQRGGLSAQTKLGTAMRRWPVAYWVSGVWAIGVLAFGACLLIEHRRLAGRVALQRPFIDETILNLLESCKQEMGVRVPVTLVETRAVGSPALFGVVRPRLLLPVGLTSRFSLEELRYIFLHELGHIKRHDILVGWLMMWVQILHWFNPLVWVAGQRMRLDRELACDALALSRARDGESEGYGQTIIKLLEGFGRSGWAPSLAAAVESKNQIKERIRMIAKFKRTSRGQALVVAIAVGLGVVTLTDAQPGGSSKDLVGTWILIGSPTATGQPPAVGGRVKELTEHEWKVTQADPESGKILFQHGGTWSFEGSDYVEDVKYGNATAKQLVGKKSRFAIKVEGDVLTLIGKNNQWKEVWRRVKADALNPQKVDPAMVEGTWRGKEAGAESEGTSSLKLKGSTLEFHGANTNEWYKANFSLYDTSPKQMVVVIKDCPAPDYVGRTGYAIYRIEDGVLTITGNEPGFPAAPSGFDAAGARKLVFKKE